MLTFEQKITIIESFPDLERKDVSLGRVNYQYTKSVTDRKNVVYHLHPNGNGFVYAEQIDDDYETDHKGMVNIRDFSEDELRKVITESIDSLSEQEPFTETWINEEGHTLEIVNDYDSWNVYAGEMLDASYATYEGAVDYLEQEGFKRKE